MTPLIFRWPRDRGLPIGSYVNEDGKRRKLGSRIAEAAGRGGGNFVTLEIAHTARRRRLRAFHCDSPFPARRSKFPARLDKFPVLRNKIPVQISSQPVCMEKNGRITSLWGCMILSPGAKSEPNFSGATFRPSLR
jgi:hypothetical protein